MATKNNPGQFDCYENAAPDEPMFILLARDPVAPALVEAWRALRAGNFDRAKLAIEFGNTCFSNSKKPLLPLDSPKSLEALTCFDSMILWYEKNRPLG